MWSMTSMCGEQIDSPETHRHRVWSRNSRNEGIYVVNDILE